MKKSEVEQLTWIKAGEMDGPLLHTELQYINNNNIHSRCNWLITLPDCATGLGETG